MKLTNIFNPSALLLLAGTGTASLAEPPPNNWTVNFFQITRNISRPDISSDIRGTFIVYRSMARQCNEPGKLPIHPLARLTSPCYWVRSTAGLLCNDYGQKKTENGWLPCDSYMDAAEGESQPPFIRDKVKWRVVNVTEDKAAYASMGPIRGGASKQRVPLQSLTVEVVNVIPVNSNWPNSVGPWSNSTAWTHSTQFTLTKDQANCGWSSDFATNSTSKEVYACFWYHTGAKPTIAEPGKGGLVTPVTSSTDLKMKDFAEKYWPVKDPNTC